MNEPSTPANGDGGPNVWQQFRRGCRIGAEAYRRKDPAAGESPHKRRSDYLVGVLILSILAIGLFLVARGKTGLSPLGLHLAFLCFLSLWFFTRNLWRHALWFSLAAFSTLLWVLLRNFPANPSWIDFLLPLAVGCTVGTDLYKVLSRMAKTSEKP